MGNCELPVKLNADMLERPHSIETPDRLWRIGTSSSRMSILVHKSKLKVPAIDQQSHTLDVMENVRNSQETETETHFVFMAMLLV